MKQQIQRVPNADEFPVLAASVTPPKLVNGNGHSGLTAAQVLQAPPPARKDASKESSTRDTTPEPAQGGTSKVSVQDITMSVWVEHHFDIGVKARG
jgi:hypothetical protein